MNEVKCDCVATLSGGKWDKTHEQSRRVYGVNGLCPTLHTCGGGNQEVKILEPPKVICLSTKDADGKQPQQQSRIYSTNGVMTALTAELGGRFNILEPCIGAMRGRNPDNPSERTAGQPTQQRLEINEGVCSNTLTTVQKDNVVVESSESGRLRNLTPLECYRLMGFSDADYDKAKWYSFAETAKLLEEYPNRKFKKRAPDGRIERVSNSQLYKQAGNSIVVNVLEAIFGTMM